VITNAWAGPLAVDYWHLLKSAFISECRSAIKGSFEGTPAIYRLNRGHRLQFLPRFNRSETVLRDKKSMVCREKAKGLLEIMYY